MKNSTLVMAAVMAVASSAVKAQSLTLPMHKRAVQSLVMKAPSARIKTMPGVKSNAKPLSVNLLDASPLSRATSRKAQANATIQRMKARMMKAREASDSKVWASGKETSYAINEDGNGWDFDSQYTYHYDDKARVASTNVTSQETDEDTGKTTINYYRVDRTYDAADRLLDQVQYNSLDGVEYTADMKLSREYDAYHPEFYTFFGYYYWNELTGKWEISDQANKYVYTRDANNNVTNVVISAPYDNDWEDLVRITNTVDAATKKIDTYKYEKLGIGENNSLVWEEDQYFTNIKWEKTNGQVGSEYESDPSKNWINDGNYLQSATVSSTGDGGSVTDTGALSLTYGADGSYAETKTYVYSEDYEGQTYTLDCKDLYTVTMIDDNGSFEIEYKSWGDYDADGVFTNDELDYHQIEVVTYDELGNLEQDLAYDLPEEEGDDEDDYSAAKPAPVVKASDAQADYEPLDATDVLSYKGLVLVQGGLNEYLYDASHGDAVVKQVSYDFDGDASFLPQAKIEVEEFVDITAAGISNAPAAQASADTAVYTLEGVKVGASLDKAPRGAYIVKSGSSVKKVVKK